MFALEIGKRVKSNWRIYEEDEDEVESKGRNSTLIHSKRKEDFYILSHVCGGPLVAWN